VVWQVHAGAVGVSGVVVSAGAVPAAGVGGRVRVLAGGDGRRPATRRRAAAAARGPRTRTPLHRRHLGGDAARVCARLLHHGGRALPPQRQVAIFKFQKYHPMSKCRGHYRPYISST
jgi:hypothetical protein